MTLETIRSALAWCSLINLVLLLFWFAYFALAHDWLYRVHSRWFGIPVERFDAIHYAAMAGFKLGVILFNLVPYFALRIVG
jgi:hypothetical protein